jgi:hypothetical protein
VSGDADACTYGAVLVVFHDPARERIAVFDRELTGRSCVETYAWTSQSDASQTRSLSLCDTRYRHRMSVTLSPRFAHKCCRYSAKYWRSERLKRAGRSNWEKRLGDGVRSANHALHFFHRPSCLSMASFCGLLLALAWEAMHRQFTR